MTDADFAVIGGGPAGASAARRLAERGAGVILFERRPMPRDKPCAGAISAKGLSWLGLPLPASLVDADVYGGRLYLGGDRMIEARLDRRIGILVSRPRFDQFLVGKAEESGARVVWQHVQALDVRPDGVKIRTPQGEFRVRCAILCEGAAGGLARHVRPRDPPGRRAFCLEANIPVRRPDPHADLAGLLGVHFNVVRRGYGWVFHHGSYYSVGLGALGSSLDRPLEAFRRFVADRGLSLDGVRVRGHMVPCGGVRRQVVADRLLLAGDAAGFVDPILWEGISYAIRSGQLAADAAMDAAGRGDLSRRGLAPYARLCHDAFGRDLRIARLLRQLAHYWPARGRMPGDAATEVFRRYLHLSFEDDTYRDFLWWLIRRAPGLWLRSVWPQRSGGAPL